MRRYREERPEINRRQRRKERLERYGLHPEDFDKLLVGQSGLCGGCSEPLIDLHIDHDDATGEVRGLLCRYCNLALGIAREDADRLRGLVAYVERF
jgi:hypothetical protein